MEESLSKNCGVSSPKMDDISENIDSIPGSNDQVSVGNEPTLECLDVQEPRANAPTVTEPEKCTVQADTDIKDPANELRAADTENNDFHMDTSRSFSADTCDQKIEGTKEEQMELENETERITECEPRTSDNLTDSTNITSEKDQRFSECCYKENKESDIETIEKTNDKEHEVCDKLDIKEAGDNLCNQTDDKAKVQIDEEHDATNGQSPGQMDHDNEQSNDKENKEIREMANERSIDMEQHKTDKVNEQSDHKEEEQVHDKANDNMENATDDNPMTHNGKPTVDKVDVHGEAMDESPEQIIDSIEKTGEELQKRIEELDAGKSLNRF